MKKQLVFIDDSGDPGFKEVSSSNFVMAAAVFIRLETAFVLSERIAEFRRSLGWRDDYEFKFAKIRKDIIIQLLQIALEYDFQIYAVYVDKASFRHTSPVVDKEKLYNWTIKELLSIIPFTDAKIEIDGRSSKQNMRRTATYLRREINSDKSRKMAIKFENSVDDNLIQLADTISGAINRYMNANKTDYATYMGMIKQRIVQIRRIDER